MRVRKAWLVHVRGYDSPDVFFAPTAGKARTQAWRSLADVTDTRIIDITARRHPSRDVMLPYPAPVTDLLDDDARHCLLHSFGADQGDPIKAGYRDYFYTRRDDPPLVRLTELGLMKPMTGDKWGENMTYFVLTAAGKHAALSLVPEYKS